MLILWSGGCDSTLAMLEALPKGDVRAISIDHVNVPAKQELTKARAAILKRLRGRGCRIDHTILTIDHNGQFSVPGCSGTEQPNLWIPNAQAFLKDEEDLATGWIRGDDVWHYRNFVFEMFSTLQTLTHKTGNLVCPLEWERKEDVIRRLKAAELYDLCWYCENPKASKKSGTPCGTCVPCRTHQAALWRIERDDSENSKAGNKRPAKRRKTTRSRR
jgi:7-cyano-7-deazaguanine synthase in queuosine biosynthesis